MKMVYDVYDRPPVGRLILYAIQLFLAIISATITVPAVVNATTGSELSMSAALMGAGIATLIYVLCTQHKSPMVISSSFTFIPAMCSAFAGAASMVMGYAGIIIGAAFAGLVYVIVAIIIKFCGSEWISKVFPPVIIGSIVAVIGLSLSGSAVTNLMSQGKAGILCGLVALFISILCSQYGKTIGKVAPFLVGIIGGYLVALAFGLIDFTPFTEMKIVGIPTFAFTMADFHAVTPQYILTIAIIYVPVALCAIMEHISDHLNMSSIIEHDLIADPGLTRSLIGDGVATAMGGVVAGLGNTSYGESIACVGVTKNASVLTTIIASGICIIVSLFGPAVAFLQTIPICVFGGISIVLFGFIAVSGLKQLQKIDFEDNANLFVSSIILVAGIGGLALNFGVVEVTAIACALVLGVAANVLLGFKKGE